MVCSAPVGVFHRTVEKSRNKYRHWTTPPVMVYSDPVGAFNRTVEKSRNKYIHWTTDV